MNNKKFYTCELYLMSEDRYIFSGIQTMEGIKKFVECRYNVEGLFIPSAEGYIFSGESRIGIIRQYGQPTFYKDEK